MHFCDSAGMLSTTINLSKLSVRFSELDKKKFGQKIEVFRFLRRIKKLGRADIEPGS